MIQQIKNNFLITKFIKLKDRKKKAYDFLSLKVILVEKMSCLHVLQFVRYSYTLFHLALKLPPFISNSLHN